MDIREELVELICRAHHNASCVLGYDGNEEDALDEEVRYLIANGVTVQEWIPVTERLPENNTIVLVYRPTMVSKIMLSYFYNRFCDGALDIYGNEVITHWMPLPAPPKGE